MKMQKYENGLLGTFSFIEFYRFKIPYVWYKIIKRDITIFTYTHTHGDYSYFASDKAEKSK